MPEVLAGMLAALAILMGLAALAAWLAWRDAELQPSRRPLIMVRRHPLERPSRRAIRAAPPRTPAASQPALRVPPPAPMVTGHEADEYPPPLTL